MKSIQETLPKILSRPETKGITTGIESLDNAIKGLQNGHLILVGGNSSTGKSSLMRNMVLAAATEVPVGVFAIEGGTFTNVEVMLYTMAQINYHNRDKLTKAQKEQIDNSKKELKKLHPIYFSDANTMYPDWILEKSKKKDSIEQQIEELHEQGARVFFVDYLQRINWGFKAENETLRLASIAEKGSALALKMNIPVVLLAQLTKDTANRANQKDADPTPTLYDLKGSGNMTQEADEILLLYRPEYLLKKDAIDMFAECSEDAQIIVAKQRFGPTGPIPVKFEPYIMKWSDKNSGKAGLF